MKIISCFNIFSSLLILDAYARISADNFLKRGNTSLTEVDIEDDRVLKLRAHGKRRTEECLHFLPSIVIVSTARVDCVMP